MEAIILIVVTTTIMCIAVGVEILGQRRNNRTLMYTGLGLAAFALVVLILGIVLLPSTGDGRLGRADSNISAHLDTAKNQLSQAQGQLATAGRGYYPSTYIGISTSYVQYSINYLDYAKKGASESVDGKIEQLQKELRSEISRLNSLKYSSGDKTSGINDARSRLDTLKKKMEDIKQQIEVRPNRGH